MDVVFVDDEQDVPCSCNLPHKTREARTVIDFFVDLYVIPEKMKLAC